MARFCEKCGRELKSENAKFCDKCGAPVNNDTNTVNNTISGVTCPQCGSMIPMGYQRCTNCGMPLEDNKTAVIIGYVITSLFSIFGLIPAIYLLTRNNGKAKTQGAILIVIILSYVFIGLILKNFILNWIIVILLIIVGIYLWINDIELIN